MAAILFGDADWSNGPSSSKPPAQSILEDEIPLLHAYHGQMRAGYSLVRCPTFRTGPSWLEALGLSEKIEAVHSIAIQLSKHTQEQGNFDSLVCGVIGPPMSTENLGHRRALEHEFAQPAIFMIDKGADCMMLQGFSEWDQFETAAKALNEVNQVPVPCSLFFRPKNDPKNWLEPLFMLGEVLHCEAVGLELPLSEVMQISKVDFPTDLAFGLQILPEEGKELAGSARIQAIEHLLALEPTLLLAGEGTGAKAWESLVAEIKSLM